MTIRRRLIVSFAAILALFGLNLAIYFVGNRTSRATVGELRQATSRQAQLLTAMQTLTDLQKEVLLVTPASESASALPPDERRAAIFKQKLEVFGQQIQAIEQASPLETRQELEMLRAEFRGLSASWAVLHENAATNHPKATRELARNAEPVAQKLLRDLERLQEEEKTRVDRAGREFDRRAMLADIVSLLLFAASIALAIAVAYRVSSYLTDGLKTVRVGAELIGSGSFNHRIPIKMYDEIGMLAQSYNEMADNLHFMRKQMTLANLELETRNKEMEKHRHASESLLLNILPIQIADELRREDKVEPKYFEDVTILFTDFVGFTLSTERVAAEELVRMLHDYFTAFDHIVTRYYLEKMKTIGDAYMCVSGMPVGRRNRRVPSHPVDAVMAALEMVNVVTERDRPDAKVRWAVRIGIHSGPVIAGVVGIQKFAFDIWGDTVNFASRMESSSQPNRINISARTQARVKDFIECEDRGRVMTKDKKEVEMYFVKGVHESLVDDVTQPVPPAFLRRYRIYFQKEPPAFPCYLVQPSEAGQASDAVQASEADQPAGATAAAGEPQV